MVRWATVDDSEQIADVHVSSWQAAYAGILPAGFLMGLDRGQRARWWRRFIGGGAMVHVEDVQRVVGFCHADDADDVGWGEIFSIYVHPDHWGRGHGLQLISAAESILSDKGHDRALLWVLESNVRGRRFYERQGWALGKPFRVEEIGGSQVTEVRYEKDLTAAS